MGFANTGRGASAARFDAGSGFVAADSDRRLDEATLARVRLVCDFVNAEIARWRGQLIAVGAACLVGMVLLPIMTKIVDERVAFVIVVGIVWFWLVRARRELASSYRNIATKRLVTATNKELRYRPVSSLTREQFASMDLFPMPGKGWKSQSEIGGHVENARFSLYAVHAPDAERGAAGFRGVIIRVDFPTSFPGHTVVFPEGHVLDTSASPGSVKRELVWVKNPKFEQMFSAYSTDYFQARRLFTATLMEFLIAAAETFGPDIRIAFVRRSLFVAVPRAGLLPDVSLLSAPLTPEEAAGEMVRLASFARGLSRAVASD